LRTDYRTPRSSQTASAYRHQSPPSLLSTSTAKASLPDPYPRCYLLEPTPPVHYSVLAMPTLQGHARTAFLCFFASHIPITLIVDGQAFFPRHCYPRALRDVVDWYAATFKDKLMMHPPPLWFSSLVMIEVLFQLPCFIIAVYALTRSQPNNGEGRHSIVRGDGLFRSLCLIYGSSTATTLIPIFACLLADADTTLGEKGILMGFYLPYFIFPVWLVVIACCEENVFGSGKSKDT
ncbi:hypothetical protein ACHAWF_012930, partial [Thalassiosira exigua]